jgi:iron complex transport system substrate-binding protein
MCNKKNGWTLFVSLMVVTVLFLSCAGFVSASDTTGAKKEITLTDMVGRTVSVQVPVERVILGSSRDLHEIAALRGDEFLKNIVGMGPDLKNWDYDTYMKMKETYPEIDNIPDVGYFYSGTFSVEKAVSLNPDVVIIPAFAREVSKSDVEKLEAAGIPVVYTDFWDNVLENPQKSMRILGQLFGKEERANEIADYFDHKITTIQDTIEKAKVSKPTVYVEVGSKGVKEYGNTYGDLKGWGTMVKAAGGENIAGPEIKSGEGSISPEYLFSKNPDKIVIAGSYWKDVPDSLRIGYFVEPDQSKELLKGFTTREGWNNLDAVKNNEVYGLFHGMSFHLTNFVGLEALAKWFYPELFSEFNPEIDLKEFHEKYMPYDYSGTWFTSLKE